MTNFDLSSDLFFICLQKLGYAPDFIQSLRPLLREIKKKGEQNFWWLNVQFLDSEQLFVWHISGIRVVTNAGGINPYDCAATLGEIAEELGIELSVAMVTGDDLMDKVFFTENILSVK